MNNKGNFLIPEARQRYLVHLYRVNIPYTSRKTCLTIVSQRTQVSEAVAKRILQRNGLL